MKDFAPEYPRDENDLILFPRDDQYRKEIFPFWGRSDMKLSEHPAKANVWLVQSIVEYVSEPEETIMDIMAGTGTIMVAALIGRGVVCIELESEYVKILELGAKDLDETAPGATDMVTIIEGDCLKLLPLQIADHIIFSPPYSNILKKKQLDKLTLEEIGSGILKYSEHPDNIGNLNEFLYHQKMERIYKKCFDSLPSKGTLTIIIKDHMEQGKRMFLGQRAKRDCMRIGFNSVGDFKRFATGTFYTKFMRLRGDVVVDDEDIIILRRPK